MTKETPELSSLETNRIVDIYNIDSVPYFTRVLKLSGTEVRIKFDKTYIEVNTTEETVNLSKYSNMFSQLLQFFYGTAYLFGVVDEKNDLLVYDVYTNDNYFSTRDLKYLEKMFCLPVAAPVIEGKLTFNNLIDIYSSLKNDYVVVLPSVYVNDNRNYVELKEDIVSKVIFGEKPVFPAYNYYNSSYYYNNNNYYNSSKKKETPKPKEVKPKIGAYALTTKEERGSIFKEVYKNVSNYLGTITSKDTDEWWKKKGKRYCYLYSIHTLPSTRQLFFDYVINNLDYILPEDEYLGFDVNSVEKNTETLSDILSNAFLDFICLTYDKEIDYDDYLYFSEVFELEFLELTNFFIKEIKKENVIV